jgi:hypothetical protein
VWADEALRDRQAELSAKGLGKLTLLATGSKELADDAVSDRVMEDMRKGIKPEI